MLWPLMAREHTRSLPDCLLLAYFRRILHETAPIFTSKPFATLPSLFTHRKPSALHSTPSRETSVPYDHLRRIP